MSSTSLADCLNKFCEVNDFVFKVSIRFFKIAVSHADKTKTLTVIMLRGKLYFLVKTGLGQKYFGLFSSSNLVSFER